MHVNLLPYPTSHLGNKICLKPDIRKQVLTVRPHLYGLRVINNRALTAVNELTDGEILGRKLTFSSFIPRDLS